MNDTHDGREILDYLFEGIAIFDREKRITYWNKGAQRITGYTADEMRGKRCCEDLLMHVNEHGIKLCEASRCPAMRTLNDGSVEEEHVYLHHKEGHLIPVSARVLPIRDSGGAVTGAVEVFNDNSLQVSARQKIEELQKIALIDSLTEMGNRRYAEITLRARFDELNRYGWRFGVLFIDVDHFKQVNDTYGHAFGDRVLRMVGRTLANSLRSFDVICRWGGEEFLGIIVNVNTRQMNTIAARLRALVEQAGIQQDDRMFHATVSIGGALARPGDTMEALIHRADKQMYKCKLEGRNRFSIEPDV